MENKGEGLDPVAQNGAVGRGEGQEGASMAKMGSDSGASERAHAEAGNGGLEQSNTQKAMQKHKKRAAGIAVITIFATVVILAIAVAVAWGMIEGSKTDKDSGTQGGGSTVVTPEEPEDELVEVSIDDEIVQGLYGNFKIIPAMFDGWWDFYIDSGVRNGEVGRAEMLRLAGANVWNSACVGDYEYGNGGKVTEDCASGEAVRRKVAEMFGVDLELNQDDKIREFCGGMIYDVANDEFHQVGSGCGGSGSARLVQVLEKAEKKGNDIYLYEKVMLFDAQEYFGVGDDQVEGEKIGEYVVPYDEFENADEYNEWLIENERKLTSEYGSEFKWIFTKASDGKYIFAGLERIK